MNQQTIQRSRSEKNEDFFQRKQLFNTKPLLFLLTFMISSFAQGTKVQICKYKNNKAAALSLTFDDGLLDHYIIAKPLMKKYGIKGTFYIVEAWAEGESNKKPVVGYNCMNWKQIKELANDGHEIGNHSYRHKVLSRIKPEYWEEEINHPIKTFQEKLKITPVTFCYPGNGWNNEIIKIVTINHINSTLQRFMAGGNHYKLDHFKQKVEMKIKERLWGVVMLHAITHKLKGWAPFPQDDKDFEDFLKYLKIIENKVWIDTFANVSKYKKLRDNISIEWNKDKSAFNLKTNLDTKIYDCPLTVKILKNGKTRLISVKPNKFTIIN